MSCSLPELPGEGRLGRVIGVDLGRRRVGVAVSDARRTVAVPYQTLPVAGDGPDSLDPVLGALVALVDEIGATAVVVGLPLALDGRRTTAACQAEQAMDRLRGALGGRTVDVEGIDERLTTVSADRALRDGGRPGRIRRAVVDQVAATVLLQAWLDAQARRAQRGGHRPGTGGG
ncbi:MAG: Holliday junction resolvase RuvX [Actinomycetota bacterium]|nr:Holliday junction resolvase RuvX [Actinomycetota bacterium]